MYMDHKKVQDEVDQYARLTALDYTVECVAIGANWTDGV